MKDYYEMSREEKQVVRQSICDRAYQEIPNDGDDHIINLGYGVAMDIINTIERNQRDDILLQGESCVIGMNGYLEEGDPRINMRHITPAGEPILVHPKGAKNLTVADSFAFINSGKLYATFLGAFEVSEDGDIANWAVSKEHAAGPGGAMALCRGAQNVFVCMIEENKFGESKLVSECSLPLTARGVVKKIFTDKGVYIPAGKGNGFQMIEKYNQDTQSYEPVN